MVAAGQASPLPAQPPTSAAATPGHGLFPEMLPGAGGLITKPVANERVQLQPSPRGLPALPQLLRGWPAPSGQGTVPLPAGWSVAG